MAETSDRSDKKSPYRKSRIIFSVFISLIALMIIWPGYTVFSSATPLILGFPLSFAWIILCTISGFIALLLLYRSDYKSKPE